MTGIPIYSSMSVQASDSPSIDAFGRWRVSNPETLFDSKQLTDAAPLVWDDQEESGTGTTSVHSTSTASTTLGVAGSTAGVRTRQTFMRFNYQPGKSQLIFLTFNLDKSGGGTGITRTVGYGDQDNGIFIRDNEGTYEIVRRSYTSGSAVDDAITQANWNLDKMDGTGPSGVTVDFTKTQIFIIDFEWLGVGRVRTGFVIDGKVYYAHEFLNANNLGVVYMSNPNLPIRYSIENDGSGVASTLEHICASVISEGGAQDLGVLKHSYSGTISSLTTGNSYAIMGGRLKSSHLSTTIQVLDVSIILTTADDGYWRMVIGGSVTGTFTFTDYANSAVQIATGASTNQHSGGTPIYGGFLNQDQPLTQTVENALRMGSSIDGTPQEWFLVFTPLSANVTLHASVGWREQN